MKRLHVKAFKLSTLRILVAALLVAPAWPMPAQAPPAMADTSRYGLIEAGGSRFQVDLEGVLPDLPLKAIEQHIQNAAQAVTVFYGKFPVPRARVEIVVAGGQEGVLQGTTWGNRDGFPAETRMRIGQHTTQAELNKDWVATHELIHMALPSLPETQRWLEEGIATYVEPIARVQAGQLPAQQIWSDMLAGMYHGEPEAGDRGLDRTHTWGRTYWGGALFCLVADIEIRKRTGNQRGLQDALIAIVKAGGAVDKDWPVGQVLRIGDAATGTSVLETLYTRWSAAPVTVDLPALWAGLGIGNKNGKVIFDDSAPSAQLRVAITAARAR